MPQVSSSGALRAPADFLRERLVRSPGVLLMLSSRVRLGLAATALLSLVLLPEAFALRPALPGANDAPAIGAAVPMQVASRELIQELTHQGLKALGVPSVDSRRLASRAIAVADAPDGPSVLDDLAHDAVALGALDAAAARDVFARMEAMTVMTAATTDAVGRAFGVNPDGNDGPGTLALGASSRITLPAGAPGAHLGGTCLSCPNFNFGPFAPTTAWQFDASSLASSGDCNWYAFDVIPGASYEFSLCNPASTGFDSVLELFTSGCGLISSADDNCAGGERITFTAGAGVTSVRLKVRGFGVNFGSYNLGYRRVCTGEPDCANPNETLPVPTVECQLASASVSDCSNAYHYEIDLIGGRTYTFTLCGSTCAGAGASFDGAVQIFNSSGVLLTSNSDACGDDGEIVFTPDTFTGTGTYCVRVVREAGASSDFTLGYRVACVAPVGVLLGPDTASTSEVDCTRNQTFSAGTSGTGTFTWSWTITPPPGSTATPSSGTETSADSSVTFTSLLQGDGDYTVNVTVTNACGTDSGVLTYNLEDRAGPVLTPTAERVSCATSTALPTRRITPTEVMAAIAPADIEDLLSEPDPDVVREALAAKLGAHPKNVVVLDRTVPGLVSPPSTMALSCGAPCTGFTTLQANNLYYDVFLDCDDGDFTAGTGVAHSVTIAAGSRQNVIFGGAGGGPGTSDPSWYVHDTGDHYLNPTGGRACLFDPADTAAEPASVGIEAEWLRNPTGLPGVTLRLREEIVAFGDSEANSGVRLTLGATNLLSSTQAVTMGVRWQIDYQNSGDDGPLFAKVTCQPFDVFDERSTEHEFTDAEIATFDFYRIQNNTSPPFFGNFTSATEIAGFPDTAKPDRLTYARWGSVVSEPWNYAANEGDPGPDFDSAVLYWFGFAPADGFTIAPGESFSRSVIIFTAGENQDCGSRRPGECATEAVIEICPGECARVGATAFDGCGFATVELVDSTPGAPTCSGNPCVISFPDEGTFVYTWRATDEVGNTVDCTSTVIVEEGTDCNQPPSCSAGGPASSECREAPVEGAFVDDIDGDEISYTWVSDNPMVSVEPAAGVIGAGLGPRALPPTIARLDDSVAPCGVTATLTLLVDDGQGGTSACTTTVLFLDDVAPTVGSASGGDADVCLWPPNHNYVPVTTADLSVLVTDGCTSATWRIVGCVSNQPDEAPEPSDVDRWNGDGNTEQDCVVSDDGTQLWVRAERCGAGVNAQDGRRYGIAVVAVDECGNESAPTIAGSVYVPHDQAPAEDGCLDSNELGTRDLP